jgi:alkylation response protein AidB-like acyl-CoA dehydrogenase
MCYHSRRNGGASIAPWEMVMRIVASETADHFRDEVRTWLHANVPKEKRPKEGMPAREFDLHWQKVQFEGGWAGISWPKEYGGRGLSLIEQMIWHEEYSRARAPQTGTLFVAVNHAGPTLIVQGTEEQKSFHLNKILRGDVTWCQGFSEPGAGSDLASLRTKGEIDGDHLVVNGSKIWTTYGHLADYQELLIRTDPGPGRHKGLSWVICDMKTPGLTVRPIKAITGIGHFSECFYDNVRIPLSQVVGQVNEGWKVAMTTLGFERGTATISHQMELSRTIEELIETAKSQPDYDDAIGAELATLRAEVAALRALSALSLSRAARETTPGAEGNIVALYFGELVRRVYQAAIRVLGPKGLERNTSGIEWVFEYLDVYKWGIGGGTLEIRRNTIGERVLGLPKMK